MATIVVKKYTNRRLYDTAAKRYINLEDLLDLLRRGDDVQVLHARSGHDLTHDTLSTLLLELRPPTRHLSTADLTHLLRMPDPLWRDLTHQHLPKLIHDLTHPPPAPPPPPADDLASLRLEIEAIKRAMLAGR
jgi:polyhydroxyalkanoate synthesis repressor PhaR